METRQHLNKSYTTGEGRTVIQPKRREFKERIRGE